METCSSCGREISDSEIPKLSGGNVICEDCDGLQVDMSSRGKSVQTLNYARKGVAGNRPVFALCPTCNHRCAFTATQCPSCGQALQITPSPVPKKGIPSQLWMMGVFGLMFWILPRMIFVLAGFPEVNEGWERVEWMGLIMFCIAALTSIIIAAARN